MEPKGKLNDREPGPRGGGNPGGAGVAVGGANEGGEGVGEIEAPEFVLKMRAFSR